ncbi:hypothetical protein MIR68_011580 [Amoeboaphelidium protococcarum]|nr:hypothetical protein MIR68_011580 [Amoeboaphelidium protococcarum]
MPATYPSLSSSEASPIQSPLKDQLNAFPLPTGSNVRTPQKYYHDQDGVYSTTKENQGNEQEMAVIMKGGVSKANDVMSLLNGKSIAGGERLLSRPIVSRNASLRQPVDLLKESFGETFSARVGRGRSVAGIVPSFVYRGQQTSNSQVHDVGVQFLSQDFTRNLLYGYLTISGLTNNQATITTCFEAEMVDDVNSTFLTGKWDTDAQIDQIHWEQFESYKKLGIDLNEPSSINHQRVRSQLASSPYVYMRWKERFLYPDHKVKNIDGASYSGFYYVEYDIEQKRFTGYYYHQNSERFQKLSLHLQDGQKSISSYEFR